MVDRRTGDPVTSAYVALVTEDRCSVVGVTVDRGGTFSLESPSPGSYFVYASALGYRPAVDGLLDLGEGGWMEVEIRLEPDPVLILEEEPAAPVRYRRPGGG